MREPGHYPAHTLSATSPAAAYGSMKWWQPAHQQQVGKQIDGALSSGRGDLERRGQPRSIQQSALAMRQHCPKPLKHAGGNAGSKLRYVPLQIGTDKIGAPA